MAPLSRALVPALLLALLAPEAGNAQLVRCELSSPEHEYGYAGECAVQPDQPPPAGRARAPMGFLWPGYERVPVVMTSGPLDPPPWHGYLLLPGRRIGFEITPRGGVARAGALVLRAAPAWVEVREWTGVGDARLVFDLGEYPATDEDDAAILEHALAALDALERWNREDDRSCDDAGSVSLFCLLQRSVRWRMGRYHHRQPALEIVRLILREGWPERLGSHPVMDFNNHPSTTRDDLRQLLRSALQRVHRELDHAARES